MERIDEKLKTLIEENPMSLATVNDNGTPNVIAVAFVKVVSDNQIVITDNYMSQTKNNIQRDKNVCIAIWDSEWNGKKFVGTAEYFTSGKWKTFIEQLKDNDGQSAKGAILVTLSKIITLC